MKVKDLIAQLQKQDPERDILLRVPGPLKDELYPIQGDVVSRVSMHPQIYHTVTDDPEHIIALTVLGLFRW